jgi:hypothetical protein
MSLQLQALLHLFYCTGIGAQFDAGVHILSKCLAHCNFAGEILTGSYAICMTFGRSQLRLADQSGSLAEICLAFVILPIYFCQVGMTNCQPYHRFIIN